MKTRAAVAFEARKPLEIVELDLEGPKAGEVLVEIMATGICHTDAYTLDGFDSEGIFPSVLGHEGAGVVREIGEGVFHRAPVGHVAGNGDSADLGSNGLERFQPAAQQRHFGALSCEHFRGCGTDAGASPGDQRVASFSPVHFVPFIFPAWPKARLVASDPAKGDLDYEDPRRRRL